MKNERALKLKNLETKLGVLRIAINNGKIKRTDEIDELFEIFNEYEEIGATNMEIDALYGDVLLALGDEVYVN